MYSGTVIGPRYLAVGLSLVALFVLAVGCSESARKEVTGTVLLDGEPLPAGQIQLRPLPGTSGPSAGASIVDGKFRIEPKSGPLAGKFRVEITASRPTGEKRRVDFSDEMTDVYEQYVLHRYNEASELEATVDETGTTELEFELSSQ